MAQKIETINKNLTIARSIASHSRGPEVLSYQTSHKEKPKNLHVQPKSRRFSLAPVRAFFRINKAQALLLQKKAIALCM
jgi:hypothetical protein